ncbi:L,D-transpeptidase [bacterium]|nr:L,D-transpeptidase [bacterium]
MKAFLEREMPVWATILAIIFMGGGMLAVLYYFGPAPRLYSVSLPPERISLGEFQYGEEPRLGNPDIFKKVKNDFLSQKASFIEADLSSMTVRLYKDGILAKEAPILTKGREGSWWETPAGIYKIESKTKNHFSSFGQVYQPWSMVFQGNFFIHGWPYYEGGKPVSSQYSGGCIRLSDEDAKAIYDLAETGMPVLVFEKDFAPDDFRYAKRTASLSAEKVFVADMKNNFVFLEKSSADAIPLGGARRLLAGLVSAEYINMEKSITLNEDDILATSTPKLREGMTVTPFDLLHLMLIEHSDEPPLVLENFLGSKRFEKLADDKARAVGMKATRFGGSGGNGATIPEDLFHLSRYIYNNRNFLFRISVGKLDNSAYGETKFRNLQNRNLFSEDRRFVGGQAFSHDDGGEKGEQTDFLGVFEIMIRGEKRPIFIFLGNSKDPKGDTEQALSYIASTFE